MNSLCKGMIVSDRDWRLISKSAHFIDDTHATYKVSGVLLQTPPSDRALEYGKGIQECNIGYL